MTNMFKHAAAACAAVLIAAGSFVAVVQVPPAGPAAFALASAPALA